MLKRDESATIRLAGRRVLVVDDSEDNLELIRLMLEDEGALVDVASNGQVGIEKAMAGAPYHTLLMDIHMPGMTGYEAASELRNRGYLDPIIALTANTLKGEFERCTDSGCDSYLSKPFKREDLVRAIADHAGRLNRHAK